jgi:hypothetical protein
MFFVHKKETTQLSNSVIKTAGEFFFLCMEDEKLNLLDRRKEKAKVNMKSRQV